MKNRSTLIWGFCLTFVLTLIPLALVVANDPVREWQAKVDPWVLDQLSETGSSEALIFMSEQADVTAAAALESKLARGTYVFDILSQLAEITQAPIRGELERLGISYRPYWIANMIWVKVDDAQLATIAERLDVARVYANPSVALEAPARVDPFAPARGGIEWNVAQINAPDVWTLGFNGTGTIVAGQDTGYDWDHPALQDQYRGWNGASADHNYSWHDAIHSGGGVCGADSPEPCDDEGHGTHTMGTMVGDDGGSNQIGVAPGADWIGCRNMDQGNGTPTTYSECFQWFVAPTDLNNLNPNPAMAPDVINNSWSCPASEGCTDPNILLTVVENTRAAGIVVVVSAGNSGPGCSSVSTAAAIYDASFSVGSTTNTDAISDFSSRGPVTVDGSNRLKPDVSAPGEVVRSSRPGGTYGTSSGTSMAGPHVAGLTALLISAEPTLFSDIDQLESLMRFGALKLTTSQTCGGVSGSANPNNTFGHGRIDALQSVVMLGVEPTNYLPFIVRP